MEEAMKKITHLDKTTQMAVSLSSIHSLSLALSSSVSSLCSCPQCASPSPSLVSPSSTSLLCSQSHAPLTKLVFAFLPPPSLSSLPEPELFLAFSFLFSHFSRLLHSLPPSLSSSLSPSLPSSFSSPFPSPPPLPRLPPEGWGVVMGGGMELFLCFQRLVLERFQKIEKEGSRKRKKETEREEGKEGERTKRRKDSKEEERKGVQIEQEKNEQKKDEGKGEGEEGREGEWECLNDCLRCLLSFLRSLSSLRSLSPSPSSLQREEKGEGGLGEKEGVGEEKENLWRRELWDLFALLWLKCSSLREKEREREGKGEKTRVKEKDRTIGDITQYFFLSVFEELLASHLSFFFSPSSPSSSPASLPTIQPLVNLISSFYTSLSCPLPSPSLPPLFPPPLSPDSPTVLMHITWGVMRIVGEAITSKFISKNDFQTLLRVASNLFSSSAKVTHLYGIPLESVEILIRYDDDVCPAVLLGGLRLFSFDDGCFPLLEKNTPHKIFNHYLKQITMTHNNTDTSTTTNTTNSGLLVDFLLSNTTPFFLEYLMEYLIFFEKNSEVPFEEPTKQAFQHLTYSLSLTPSSLLPFSLSPLLARLERLVGRKGEEGQEIRGV